MEPTDAELVRQCLQGDNSGFDTLVRRYQKQITGFCYRVLGDSDLAADAAQEAFLKAYHALPGFRQEASFLSWVFRIANNTCFDIARKQARRRSDWLDEPGLELEQRAGSELSPEVAAVSGEKNRLLQNAVLSLPVRQRMSVVLFYFHDMKMREIADALDLPIGTVKSHLHLAREALRRKLEGVLIET